MGQIGGVRALTLLPLSALLTLALAFSACGGGSNATSSDFDGGEGTDGGAGDRDGAAAGDGDLFAFDGNASDAPPVNVCKVQDEDQGTIPTCTKQAPSIAFTPTLKWKWTATTDAGGGFGIK